MSVVLATAGYDHKAIVWDMDTAEPLIELVGHNGPIFDVALDAAAETVATASGDGTIKIWRVSDGLRLDTRSEPLKEQFSVAISPDNNWLFGAGADNRLRKWRFVSKQQPRINKLHTVRFAHDAAIQFVRCTPNGFRCSISRHTETAPLPLAP